MIGLLGSLLESSGGSAGGELTGTYPNPSLANSAVIAKVLAGYVSGAGTISATDTILQAIQKLNGNIAEKENALTTIINESTIARTLVLTDAFKYIRTTNSSATVITIPTNASVAFLTGTQIDCMQIGAGALSFVASAGVTVNNSFLAVSARYKAATLIKVGTNEWDLIIG